MPAHDRPGAAPGRCVGIVRAARSRRRPVPSRTPSRRGEASGRAVSTASAGTALALALLLAACRSASPADEPANAATSASPVEAVRQWVAGIGDERARIPCALGAGAPFAPDCRIEIVEDARGRLLILSRPDGAFRRVRIGADGTPGAADGAAEPRTARSGDTIGIAFGDERYAVPVAALGGAPPR